MASSSPSGSSGDDSDLNSVPPNSLAGLSLSIFSDLLANITHDIALQSHRSEKLLRTKQLHLLPPTTDGSPPPTATANPLAVVPTEIICSRCHLPQHTAHTLETTTAAAQKKKFCPRLPFQDAPFHDIYGNPFPTVKETAGKKGDSNKSGDSPPEEGTAAVTVTTGNGKKGAAVYFKCTCCDKEKVPPSHFAKHLEKCLGLGRKSSRAAMAKMNNSNSGSGAGSPMLSAADAAAQGSKAASRKASPEKKSKSPVPLEEAVAPPPATPVLPPKPIFATSVTDLAGSAPTPKKKKKKITNAAAAAAAVAKAGSAPPEDDKGLLAMPETPTKPIDVPSLPPLPPPILAKEPTQKKRKRKAEIMAAAAADAAAATTAAGGEESRDAITVSLSVSKPPPKKQKLALGGEKPTVLDSAKKSQLSKFKNRANSPSPGGGSSKKGETIRKSSPAPHASPPTTHKSLPPKPPVPLTGPLSAPPMAASSSSQGATPKQRKPKLGALGGSVKKAAAAAAAAGTGVGVGDGASPVKKAAKPKVKKVVAGKTVPVPKVPGKTVPVPGVARKGPKE